MEGLEVSFSSSIGVLSLWTLCRFFSSWELVVMIFWLGTDMTRSFQFYLYSTEKKHTLKKNQGSERKKKKKRGSVHRLHGIPIYSRCCNVNKSGLRADPGLNKSTTTPAAPPSRANIAFVSLFWCEKFIHLGLFKRKIKNRSVESFSPRWSFIFPL